jgi:heme exporter protein C
MKGIALIAMAALIVAAFMVPPAKGFPEPDLARIIFFHLPCAFASTFFVLFGAYCSVRYLVSRSAEWDFRAHAATEMAMTLATATMLTGILFSKVQWGAWWHWDPRQTSFLVVLLLLGAYFAIRMAYADEVMRARASATYSAVTLLPVLFLFFVFPRLPQVLQKSLHPSTTVQTGAFSPDYWAVVLGVFVVLMGYALHLYRLHVRASLLEHRIRNRHGNLETAGHDPTPRRVDPPLHVREPS